jgi:hypothetical protein
MTHLRHQDGLNTHYLLALVPAQPRIGSFPPPLDKSEPPRITPPPLSQCTARRSGGRNLYAQQMDGEASARRGFEQTRLVLS